MSDWRQIQARIRKAKGSKDPAGQLAALFERTRDAMVAYELGQVCEKTSESAEAVRWYTTAAQRFRRAQWKTKAEEALTRLGASLPETKATYEAAAPEPAASWAAPIAEEAQPSFGESPTEQAILAPEIPAEAQEARASGSAAEQPRKKRRRGRRGGRGRRKGRGPSQPALQATPSSAARQPPRAEQTSAVSPWSPRPAEGSFPYPRSAETVREEPPAKRTVEAPRMNDLGSVSVPAQLRGRAGDPALASRLALLESQLRRLIAGAPHRVDESEQPPAGPGVFLLSDSDLTTHYYIESCQTLRIGVGNLLRGERGRRVGESLRTRFADHLGISESRISRYLKEHCAVRWLQLDEGAGPLAHFAIAVLRPALNE